MARDIRSSMISRAVLAAAGVIIIAALYFAREVLVPFSLAVLLSFLLSPLVTRLERLRLGRAPSVIVCVLLALGILGGVAWMVGDQLVDLAHKLPEYQRNIEEKIHSVQRNTVTFRAARRTLSELSQEIVGAPPSAHTPQPSTGDAESTTPQAASQAATGAAAHSGEAPPAPHAVTGDGATPQKPVPVSVVEPSGGMISFVMGAISSLASPLATVFIVALLVFFMLLQREDLGDRAIRLIGGGQISVTTEAINDAGARISRYLAMQLTVNVSYGVLVAIGLYFIGIPNALLWGLMATVLRFLPYIGPWLAASFPLVLSLAAPGWSPPVLTVALFVVVELIANNIEPLLYGSSTGLSSVAILLAAVFWTWLWGAIGLLLSTPLTVLLVVLGKYVSHLEFLTIMLGDQPVLAPSARLYQRLLSSEFEDVEDLTESLRGKQPLIELYDNVLIPALVMARQDLRRGKLDAARAEHLRASMLELVEDLAPEATPGSSDENAVQILCVPSRDEFDEIATLMLHQMLLASGVRATLLHTTQLASETLAKVEENGAEIVCISALPPCAISHSRYLCKRVHEKSPDVAIVAGLWQSKLSADAARRRLTCTQNDAVVMSLADAVARLRSMAAAHATRMEARQQTRVGAIGRAASQRTVPPAATGAAPAAPTPAHEPPR